MSDTEGRPSAPSGDVVADTSAALVPMLARVLETYRALADVPVADDPKLATAQQQACKAALAHLEALMKLIRLTGPPADGDGDDGRHDAAAVVARAKRAFDTYRGEDA